MKGHGQLMALSSNKWLDRKEREINGRHRKRRVCSRRNGKGDEWDL